MSAAPQPCRFFQQGRCSFGDQCRNLHGNLPIKANPTPVAAGFRCASSAPRPAGKRGLTHSPRYSREGIQTDLTKERPKWILSSYAPGKNERNLLDGHDLSPEELRLRFYAARAAGNPALYVRQTLSPKRS